MIRTQPQPTTLERLALEQRLSKLGLTVGAEGAIDASRARVQGPDGQKGVEALQAVATPEGLIGLDQAVLLQRQRGFLALFRGRDASVSEKHSAALKSLAMSADGLATEMSGATKQLAKGLDDKKLDAVTRRADQVARGLEGLITGDANIAACSPESVRALAQSLGTLTDVSSAYLSGLSVAREAAFAKSADMTPEARKSLIKSLLESASQLERLSGISRTVSAANLSVIDPSALGKLEQKALETAEQARLKSMSPDDALQKLGQLTDGFAQQNAATVERQKLEALEKKAQLEELTAQLPAFDQKPVVVGLARFVKEVRNPPDATSPAGQQQVITLGSFSLGEEGQVKGLSADNSRELNMLMIAMTPDKAFGEQKLLLTANGLRVYGPSKWDKHEYTTRKPTAHELAGAGWTLAKLEQQLGEVAKSAAASPDKIKTSSVRVNRDDLLMANGLTRTMDPAPLMKDLEAALSVPAHLRGPEVVKVLDAPLGTMSAGEYRDFAIQVMNRVAGTSRGGGHRHYVQQDMQLWVHPQHMVLIRDAVLTNLRKYPFEREKGDFVGDTGIHRAMKDLFYATESGSTCYKVFDPNGKEVSISNHQYGDWCEKLKALKPYRYENTWY